MHIQIKETDDPQKVFFHLYYEILPEPEKYGIEASNHISETLHAINGITGTTLIGLNRIKVRRKENVTWEELLPDILHVIKSLIKNKGDKVFLELPTIKW